MLDFFNTNNTIITLVFFGTVSIATIVYAVLTWRLVSETRQMRKAQTEPKVSVIVQPKESRIYFLDIVIQNIGLGPAYEIKFELEKDFECFNGKYLGSTGVFKQGISYMAPSQKTQFFFTNMIQNHDEKIKSVFEVKVSYKDTTGSAYSDIYTIDLSHFEGMTQLGEPPLYKIAQSLENMQKDIGRISTGFSRLKVNVYTTKDVECEERKEQELLEEFSQKRGEP